MRDSQIDSQSYIQNREEEDRGDQEKEKWSQTGETNLASKQFLSVLHSSEHSERFTK